MDLHAAAAERISALFKDRGAAVLAEGQLGASWPDALSGLPESTFLLRGESPHPVGERLLSRVRDTWAAQGELRKAVATTRGLVRLRTVRLGAGHPGTLIELGALGALADRAGQRDEAYHMLEQAQNGLMQTVGEGDLRVAIVSGNLALHFMRHGRPDLAEQELVRALAIRRDKAPATTGVVAAQLADLYLRSERDEQAIPLLREAYEQTRERFGPLHARTVPKARVYAAVLTQFTQYDVAEPVLRDLYEHARQHGDDEQQAQAAFDLGMALRRVDRKEEAYRVLNEAVSLTRRIGDPHETLPERLTAWARVTLERRRPDEAEGLFREALQAETRLHGEGSVQVAIRYAELGKFIADRGRLAEGMGWLDPAASLLRGELGGEHPVTLLAAENLVELLLIQADVARQHGDRGANKELLARAEEWSALLDRRHPLKQRLLEHRQR